jgi:putative endonuclease
MEKQPTVYMTVSGRRGYIYVGVTSDIVRREDEHYRSQIAGYSKDRDCRYLVWMETHADMESAIRREKTLKKWMRDWKMALIEESNPDWHPLDPVTGCAMPEEQRERNLRGGWMDDDGNVGDTF